MDGVVPTLLHKLANLISDNDGTPVVHSPWDPSPMAAPAGSIASAGPAPPVANGATGAAAAAATARMGATSAQIRLATSTDLPRREREGQGFKQSLSSPVYLLLTALFSGVFPHSVLQIWEILVYKPRNRLCLKPWRRRP